MRSRQKLIVTLSMIWIGAMAVLSTPEWVRAARDFVSSTTGHGSTPSTGAGGNANRTAK